MDIGALSTQLANNASSIAGLSRWVSDDQARWKPDAQSWSVLEVINHLYDEERKDFRLRLEYILFRPGQPWEPINPQGWVIERVSSQ